VNQSRLSEKRVKHSQGILERRFLCVLLAVAADLRFQYQHNYIELDVDL